MLINTKGQGAMEFLVTYGWAFLIVLIMIGALSHFGVFGSFNSEKCVSSPEFECYDYAVSSSSQVFRFKNNLDESIKLSNASVTIKGDEGTKINCYVPSESIESGQLFDVSCEDNLTGDKNANLDIDFNYYSATSSASYSKPHSVEVSGRVENNGIETSEITQESYNDFRSDSVSSCGASFEENTVYFLNKSISSSGSCFVIDKRGASLDCKGYSIEGDGSGAAIVVSADDVSVKNCVINNYDKGIVLEAGVSDISLIQNDVETPETTSAKGIYAYGSSNSKIGPVTIKSNSVHGGGNAVFMYYVKDITMSDNSFNVDSDSNSINYVVYISMIEDSSISNNNVVRTGTEYPGQEGYVAGFRLALVSDSSVSSNTVTTSKGSALWFSGGSNLVLSGNTGTTTGTYVAMALLSDCSGCTISSNTFAGTPGLGAQIGGNIGGSTFTNNNWKGNIIGGVVFYGGGSNPSTATFSGNTFEGVASPDANIPGLFSYATYPIQNIVFSGNTFISGDDYAISLNSQSNNNKFYENIIKGPKWVNNGNSGNLFDYNGHGNKYRLSDGTLASSVLTFVDDDSDGWADSGASVPLSSTTASAYWTGSGSDSHPFMN